jgi:6-phosphofructokinase 1
MFGSLAVDLIAGKKFGTMTAFIGPHVGAIKINDAIGRLKTVPPDGALARTARSLCVSLGD